MNPDAPKHWRPKMLSYHFAQVEGLKGAWIVGFYDGGRFESDGGTYTYAEAQKRAAWLNEQEQKEQEEVK